MPILSLSRSSSWQSVGDEFWCLHLSDAAALWIFPCICSTFIVIDKSQKKTGKLAWLSPPHTFYWIFSVSLTLWLWSNSNKNFGSPFIKLENFIITKRSSALQLISVHHYQPIINRTKKKPNVQIKQKISLKAKLVLPCCSNIFPRSWMRFKMWAHHVLHLDIWRSNKTISRSDSIF